MPKILRFLNINSSWTCKLEHIYSLHIYRSNRFTRSEYKISDKLEPCSFISEVTRIFRFRVVEALHATRKGFPFPIFRVTVERIEQPQPGRGDRPLQAVMVAIAVRAVFLEYSTISYTKALTITYKEAFWESHIACRQCPAILTKIVIISNVYI